MVLFKSGEISKCTEAWNNMDISQTVLSWITWLHMVFRYNLERGRHILFVKIDISSLMSV
jgi:hypothetical protein